MAQEGRLFEPCGRHFGRSKSSWACGWHLDLSFPLIFPRKGTPFAGAPRHGSAELNPPHHSPGCDPPQGHPSQNDRSTVFDGCDISQPCLPEEGGVSREAWRDGHGDAQARHLHGLHADMEEENGPACGHSTSERASKEILGPPAAGRVDGCALRGQHTWCGQRD